LFILISNLTGCFSFDRKATIIKNGFSTELKDMLKRTYEITIPQYAVFIDGSFDNAFKGPSVTINFKIPEDKKSFITFNILVIRSCIH